MKQKKEFNFARRWELEQAKLAGPSYALPLNIIAWGIGGTIVGLVIFGSPWIWAHKVKTDLQKVNERIKDLRSVELQVKKITDLNSQIQKSKQFLELVNKENRDPIEVLYKLKELLPLGTVVNSFSYAGDSISIEVSIPVPVDVARLWVSLRDSGVFENVDIQSVSLVDQVQKLTLAFRYNSKAEVKYPASADQTGIEKTKSEDKGDAKNPQDPQNPKDPTDHQNPSEDDQLTSDAPDSSSAIRYPDIPKGLVTVPVSNSSIDLSWKSAIYATTYNVYRSSNMKQGYKIIANVKKTGFRDIGLAPGTAYYYKVSSLKDTGVEGYFDNPVGTVTFDLDSPSGFVAETSSRQIDLSWNTVEQATACNIYRSLEGGSFNLIVTVPDTRYSDTGLSTGNYRYKINAVADKKSGGAAGPITVKLTY